MNIYLRWCVYNPVTCPCPLQFGVGHLFPSVGDKTKLCNSIYGYFILFYFILKREVCLRGMINQNQRHLFLHSVGNNVTKVTIVIR